MSDLILKETETQIHVVSCGNTVKVVKSEISLKLRINFAGSKTN